MTYRQTPKISILVAVAVAVAIDSTAKHLSRGRRQATYISLDPTPWTRHFVGQIVKSAVDWNAARYWVVSAV